MGPYDEGQVAPKGSNIFIHFSLYEPIYLCLSRQIIHVRNSGAKGLVQTTKLCLRELTVCDLYTET